MTAAIDTITPADIQKIFQDWFESGVADLFKSNELREPCLRLLDEYGCRAPANHLVYMLLSRSVIHALQLSVDLGSSKMFEFACRLSIFRNLVLILHKFIGSCVDKSELSRQIIASLRGENIIITMPPNELLDLDALSILKNQQNFNDLSKNLDEIETIIQDFREFVGHIPSLLNAPPLYDPNRSFQKSGQLTGFQSLYYGAGFDRYIGRQTDLDFLQEFLYCSNALGIRPFAWQLLFGGAGIGKSRLALQILHNLPPFWRGGFLKLYEIDKLDLSKWEPSADTLIIVDYASADVVRLSRFLNTLEKSSQDYRLWRVRVLLLERNASTDWLRRLQSSSSGEVLKLTCHKEAFELTQLSSDDLVTLIKTRLHKRSQTIDYSSEDLLERLKIVDPECRPLFASILAEDLADGVIIGSITRQNLLTRALDRERLNFWLNSDEKDEYIKSGRMPCDVYLHANLLCLATMVKGLSLLDYGGLTADEVLGKVFPSPTPGTLDSLSLPRLRRMSSVTNITGSGNGFLRPLEPDLLGELFVLRNLTGEDHSEDPLSALSEVSRQRLVDIAWEINHHAMTEFLMRAGHDYPVLLRKLNYLKPSEEHTQLVQRFADALVYLIQGKVSIEYEREANFQLNQLLLEYSEDPVIREAVAHGASNLITSEGQRSNLSEARRLFDLQKGFLFAHFDDVAVRYWTKASALNLMSLEATQGNVRDAHGYKEFLFRFDTIEKWERAARPGPCDEKLYSEYFNPQG